MPDHDPSLFLGPPGKWLEPAGYEIQIRGGAVLSGEKLVDDSAFRDSLLATCPVAIGGEIEGAGAYSAASRYGKEVILVKAICDWADGRKNDRAQPFAARAATDLVRHVLSKPDVLKELGARVRTDVRRV